VELLKVAPKPPGEKGSIAKTATVVTAANKIKKAGERKEEDKEASTDGAKT